MSEHARASWLPWRGRNPVRWTFALALSVLAVMTAVVTGEKQTPPLAAGAALLALFLAPWPRERPTPWPWRSPDPLRNTVADVLFNGAVVVVLLDALFGLEAPWTPAAIAALLLASAVASTRFGRWAWLHRLAWACAVGLSVWLWHRWTR